MVLKTPLRISRSSPPVPGGTTRAVRPRGSTVQGPQSVQIALRLDVAVAGDDQRGGVGEVVALVLDGRDHPPVCGLVHAWRVGPARRAEIRVHAPPPERLQPRDHLPVGHDDIVELLEIRPARGPHGRLDELLQQFVRHRVGPEPAHRPHRGHGLEERELARLIICHGGGV